MMMVDKIIEPLLCARVWGKCLSYFDTSKAHYNFMQ